MLGTTISDLSKKDSSDYYDNIRNLQDMGQTNYNAGQNMHYEQGHNAAHQMHQAQQQPYYNIPNAQPYPQQGQPSKQPPGYLTPKEQQKLAQEVLDMEELAKDINDNLPDDTFASVSETGEDNASSGSLHLLSSIPALFREPIVILLLYILLSQAAVKDTIGTYIKQINPDIEGKVSFAGVLIYGVIFAALFALIKKFIL